MSDSMGYFLEKHLNQMNEEKNDLERAKAEYEIGDLYTYYGVEPPIKCVVNLVRRVPCDPDVHIYFSNDTILRFESDHARLYVLDRKMTDRLTNSYFCRPFRMENC